MLVRKTSFVLAVSALASLVGCGSARPIAEEGSGVSACTVCHGDATRSETVPLNQAAPPATVSGGSAGAHLSHLHDGPFRAGVACSDCHVVPGTVSHSDGVVTVTFSARAGGASASYDPATGTCSGVACHGARLSGGPAASPPWTSTSPLGCTSCHGAPPPNHAPTSTDCSVCHPGTVLPNGTIDVANGLHMNGTIDVNAAHPTGWSDPAQHGYTANRSGFATCKTCHGADLAGGSGPACSSCHGPAGFPSWETTCTFCHGNRTTGRVSPPVDTQGRSATSNVSVGVHDSHVGSTISTPIACTECHPDRTGSNVITDPAHVDGDGQAEIVFGALAKTGGVTPVFTHVSSTSATCAAAYCHGNFLGGANATPNWTSTTPVTCTSCHGIPPGTGRHSLHTGQGVACGTCHSGYTATSVVASTHVNGTKNVQFTVTGTWNPTTKTCSSVACHGAGSTMSW